MAANELLSVTILSVTVHLDYQAMNNAVIEHVKKTHRILIGDKTADAIRQHIGSAFPLATRLTMEVRGRHIAEGIPKTIELDDSEIRLAVAAQTDEIVGAIKKVVALIPSEKLPELKTRGIVLEGDVLKNLDKRLTVEFDLPIEVKGRTPK